MKYKKETKDINYVNNLLQPGEIFVLVTDNMVPGVFDYYQVSNYGRVYHNYMKKILKTDISNCGYERICLSTSYGYKKVSMHRLVLYAFNPIPDMNNYEVNHKNGNKLCNMLWNLEWVSSSENKRHLVYSNLVEYTISNETAIEICELLKENIYTNLEIAEICNVNEYTVSQIKNHKSWKHISEKYDFKFNRSGNVFTQDQLNNLCKYFETHSIGNLNYIDHCKNALIYCGYDVSDQNINSLRRIYRHETYTKISKKYNF